MTASSFCWLQLVALEFGPPFVIMHFLELQVLWRRSGEPSPAVPIPAAIPRQGEGRSGALSTSRAWWPRSGPENMANAPLRRPVAASASGNSRRTATTVVDELEEPGTRGSGFHQ